MNTRDGLQGCRLRAYYIVPVLVFCSLFAVRSSQPLHLDNMDFPAVARATSESGLPIYYRGEENPQHSGLYHPPLYIYLLAGWFRVVGFGESQARVFGMLCVLAQGWLVLRIIQTIFGRVSKRRLETWFWLLFLLNPYTLQGASIADIDTTIYGPAISIVLLLTLRLSWSDGEWRAEDPSLAEFAAVAVALAVCLWCKLTTVLLVIPFVVLLLVERLGALRAAKVGGLMIAGGVLGFAVSYCLYGAYSGQDIGYSLSFTWSSFVTRGTSGGSGIGARLAYFRLNLQAMIPFVARWTGLLPWAAATGALIACGAASISGQRRARHYGLLLLLALISTVYYCAKVQTFGMAPFKYIYPYWALVMTTPVVLALDWRQWLLSERPLMPQTRSHSWSWTMLSVVGIVYLAGTWVALQTGDRHILNGDPLGWNEYGAGVLLAGALVAVEVSTGRVRGALRALLLASIATSGGQQLGLALAQTRVEYSTVYDYGQQGLADTAAFIKLNTEPDILISSMKDVGFLADRRYYENYGAIYGGPGDTQRLIDVIAAGQVRFVVFTEGRGQDQLIVNPVLSSWIDSHCRLVKSIGHYRIYELSSSTQ